MKKLQETAYMYASARLRALENHLLGQDRVDLLVEARSVSEVTEKLAEYGFGLPDSDNASDSGSSASDTRSGEDSMDTMLSGILRDAYDEVETCVPDPSVFRLFRYPYDNNNLKVALKCLITGTDPKGLLFDFGTVSADLVPDMVREGHCEAFPPALSDAVGLAREAFAKNGDPQRLDAILDRACFVSMLRCAADSGEEFLIRWVRAKVDLTNILICLRLLRMGQGEVGRSLMEETLLPGGHLPEAFFTDAYEAGEEGLWTAVRAGSYRGLADAETDTPPLYAVEKRADDLWMRLVREDARVPFGAPVAAGYLVGCETEVKNIRLILAAKDAGLPNDILRERVRESYV